MSSLKEIAADLGVSHTLVSRVLNNRMGSTGVSAKTREAILRHAKKMGYEPNPLALALRQGRRGGVGVFVHDVGVKGSSLNAQFLEGAGNALADIGINLLLRHFTGADDFERSCNAQLLSKVDGLIVSGMAFPWMMPRLRELEKSGLPVVLACHGQHLEEFVNFQVDEEMQGYLPARHLLELGCRRIAHFMARPARYAGYLRAHTEAGVPVDDRLIVRLVGPKIFSAARGFDGARRLVESGIPYDAIHTQSDATAAGALQYFAYQAQPREHWPRITGVDNSPIAEEYALVPLTSVTAEMEACARLAVAAINRKLHAEPAQSQLVTPQLIVRASTLRAS